MKQEIINYLKGKKILILGFGREGKSALDFIRTNLPEAEVVVADQNPLELENIAVISGPDYLDACANCDIIIKSPGVVIKNFIPEEQKQKITSITDLFLRFCPNPIVGITGTKGKSTTSSLTDFVLRECGRRSILAGNIGKPCFDIIDEIRVDTTIVLELSCHQLEFVSASPHIAILLNLYEEHLDHYLSAADYYSAKKNIFKHQKADDYLIYGDVWQHTSPEEIEHAPAGTKIDLSSEAPIKLNEIHTQLLGEHFAKDILAVYYACTALGLEKDEILQAIAKFHGLPHRLEYIGRHKNIDFYNDSIATAQEAVISAIKAVKNVDTIILGGMDRGLDYHPLVEFLRSSSVRNVLLLPNTAESFERIFNEAPYSQKLIYCENLEAAVLTAYHVTAEGYSCLLSPAAASYGFYKNFEERGKHFCELVQKYSTES